MAAALLRALLWSSASCLLNSSVSVAICDGAELSSSDDDEEEELSASLRFLLFGLFCKVTSGFLETLGLFLLCPPLPPME